MHDAPESSVLFNLAELQRMERDRVAAETAAAREAERLREHEARAARAAEEREALARAQQARAAHEQAERDRRERERAHEAALLRTRLEVEAAARAEQERLAREHEQRLRALDAEARAQRGVRRLQLALVAMLAVGGTAYGLLVAPALAGAHEQRLAALDVAARHARERADLEARSAELERRIAQAEREAMEATTDEATPGATPGPTRPSKAASQRQRREARTGRRPRPSTTRGAATRDDPLGDLDLEGDDPLDGMVSPTRARR